MKVAVVSNIFGYGKILQEVGTPIVLALQEMQDIEDIDVYTHIRTDGQIVFSEKVKVIPIINPEKLLSYFQVYEAISSGNYKRVLVNSMPTSQGNKNVPNLLFLLMPILWSKLRKIKVSVVYHNSPYLNDVRKLGYSSFLDLIKTFVIRFIERRMFATCNVYFLLKQYADRIKEIIQWARTDYLKPDGITGFTTLYLNDELRSDRLERICRASELSLLLYGSWGPQKDISKALDAVKTIKNLGLKIDVTVAGDVNLHFQSYKEEFEKTLSEYSTYVDKRMQYVDEIDLYSLFLNADIIVLPYVTPGGFSGVLSVAMLFGLQLVLPEFEEYTEQAKGYDKVHFIPIDFKMQDIVSAVEDIVKDQISAKERIIEPKKYFEEFLSEAKKLVN